jgi:hypothetical protein
MNVLLYLWQMKRVNIEYTVSKWIMKIHIVSKEYKLQHMEINLKYKEV